MAAKCPAGFEIRLIYLFFPVDEKHSHNRLCDKNTEMSKMSKEKFIIYCTKSKELVLAQAHVFVSLNLTGSNGNSISMRLALIGELTQCKSPTLFQYYSVVTKGNKNLTDTSKIVPLRIHWHVHDDMHMCRITCLNNR